ncbi:MAG: hypothetical protein WCK48_01100 [bacterium]
MKKFVYLFTGGANINNKELMEKVNAQWGAYFQKLGDSIVDPGNPLGSRQSVGGSYMSQANGYSIVKAGSLEEAVEMTKECPVFANGGSVEVLEVVSM